MRISPMDGHSEERLSSMRKSKPYKNRQDNDTREPYALKGARTVRWGVVGKGTDPKRERNLAGYLPYAEMGGVTVINGKTLSLSVPTAFAKADTSAMQNLGINVEQTNAHVIQFYGDALAYAVGELALQQAVDVYHGRGDIQRYASRYSLRGLLTIAAALIPDTEFGLYVVTGLPAETYIKNLALRNTIKTALDGTHIFSVDSGKTLRRVTVEVATVVMEGAGALIAYGEKLTSKMTESAVIDIGGRTTDLYVARGQVPVTEYCKGKPLGVET